MAVATLTMLTGGAFQDSNGSPLAFGYLTLKLSQDGNVAGVGNICSGVTITIQLDVNGNVASLTSPTPVANQYVWANSNISPINTYYKVTGYTQEGQRAFGLNNQQVAAGATFNVGTWVPNSVISWFPSPQALALEVNSVAASSQTVQNLEAGANITITDEGGGNIQIAASGGSSGSPVGSNITACPVLPDYNTATSGLNGYSIFMKIPASLVRAVTTAGVKIGLWTATTTGLVVNSASIGATLPNSVAWTTTQVPITFPAGSFSAASTLYLSNTTVITIDTQHDYWIVVYIDPGSTGGSAYAALTSIPSGSEWYFRGHYLNGNYTSQSDASSLQTSVVNNPSAWFSFGQVVVA
jgi:hypothetical protein